MSKRKLRKRFQPKVINVIAEGDENKKRWKVAVYSLVADISTIFADSPQEATAKMQQGFGRHAGQEGPTVIGIACAEMDTPRAKDFITQFMSNLQNMATAAKKGQVESNIVVPKIQVVPK